MTSKYLVTFIESNDKTEWRHSFQRKLSAIVLNSLITISFNIATVVSDDFGRCPFSGNIYMSFGSTLSKLANICSIVAAIWVIIHSWLLLKVTNSFDLARKITAAINEHSTYGLKWTKRFENLSTVVVVVFEVISCFMSFGLSINLVIAVIMSVYWIGLGYSIMSNLFNDSLLLYETCGRFRLTLNGIQSDLQELLDFNGKKPMVILRLKLIRNLKTFTRLMASHSELNQFWSVVISTSIVSFITAIAVCMTTWLIDEMHLWIKLTMTLLSLMVFFSFSFMLLMAAQVNSEYRAIYHLLARMCASSKIGHSVKMKLSYSCTRYRRPIGFTQADGTVIDYMSYHEVGQYIGQPCEMCFFFIHSSS